MLYNTLIILAILLISFLVYRIVVVKNAVKKLQTIVDERIRNWKPIFPPPNEQYIIVRGRDLKNNDLIIQNGLRFEIQNCQFGKFAGSFEFGEYITIIGKFINTNPTDINPIKTFWVYQDSPIVKCVSE